MADAHKSILVTGCAGFIGSALTRRLLERGQRVIGLDNLNDYYDPSLKLARLALCQKHSNFAFHKIDVADSTAVQNLFESTRPDVVVHLAAQAGVRYSIQNPHAYVDSNLKGFLNILEGCRHNKTGHLIYASTSSVYGLNETQPLSVHHGTAHPVSFYSATKKANELMAHSYSAMYGIPTTGVRFFTVYGPWGRPDMALFLFTRNILEGKPIRVFNFGKHKRDFTYIDDLVDGLERMTLGPAAAPAREWDARHPDPSLSSAPYRIYNIGNGRSEQLMRYIEVIEECLGRKAEKIFEDKQAGDVDSTLADVTELSRDYGYQPSTPIEVGVRRFVEWFRDYYKL